MTCGRRIALSGCSGGGKSTLLEALAQRGFRTFAEPGRRIVRAALETGEGPLPDQDLSGFARAAAELARCDFEAAAGVDLAFFDRTVIDAAAAIERAGLHIPEEVRAAEAACRYDSPVFLVPPWREIYRTDEERRHDFAEAEAEHHYLVEAFAARGYDVVVLPKQPTPVRVEFILDALGL